MRWPTELLTKVQRERLLHRDAGFVDSKEVMKVGSLVRLLVEQPTRVRRLSLKEVDPKAELLFGLDGDNTGTVLEELFLSAEEESQFRQLSNSVTSALQAICHRIEERCTTDSIIFAAGDDVLFRGRCDAHFLQEMQEIYRTMTGGLTCSVGYGRSFREVYLALKLAKAEPGKNSIAGVEL